MAFDITWNKFAPGHSSRQRWSISLAGVFFYLAVSALLAPAVIAGPDKRPNILLIVADSATRDVPAPIVYPHVPQDVDARHAPAALHAHVQAAH